MSKLDSMTSVSANGFVIVQGTLYDYNGLESEVIIPQGVTAVWGRSFEKKKNLTAVTIPEGVTSIGERAFYGCSNISEIILPKSVTSIGASAFYNCSNLRRVILSENVTTVGEQAFWGCNKLAELELPVEAAASISKFCPKDGNMRIRIRDISVLPAKFRPLAVICFAEDGGRSTDPRFESHAKYIKANAVKLIDRAIEYPSLLSLMCREKLIAPKDVDAFLAAMQSDGSTERIAVILDYQNSISRKKKLTL